MGCGKRCLLNTHIIICNTVIINSDIVPDTCKKNPLEMLSSWVNGWDGDRMSGVSNRILSRGTHFETGQIFTIYKNGLEREKKRRYVLEKE